MLRVAHGAVAEAWRETFDECSNKPLSLMQFFNTMVRKDVLKRSTGRFGRLVYAPNS